MLAGLSAASRDGLGAGPNTQVTDMLVGLGNVRDTSVTSGDAYVQLTEPGPTDVVVTAISTDGWNGARDPLTVGVDRWDGTQWVATAVSATIPGHVPISQPTVDQHPRYPDTVDSTTITVPGGTAGDTFRLRLSVPNPPVADARRLRVGVETATAKVVHRLPGDQVRAGITTLEPQRHRAVQFVVQPSADIVAFNQIFDQGFTVRQANDWTLLHHTQVGDPWWTALDVSSVGRPPLAITSSGDNGIWLFNNIEPFVASTPDRFFVPPGL